jgi:F420-0:gamma-glutamyl ligase
MEPKANEGKNLITEVGGVRYARLPIHTHLITDKDSIAEVALQYAAPVLQSGDVVFITEKAVACTQNRAIPMAQIRPRKLACFLSAHVTKTPHGIGLGMISYTAIKLFTGKGKEVSVVTYVISVLFLIKFFAVV